MKRQIPGLAETARDSRPEMPDGVYLVRVEGAQFRWHAHKPFYVLRLSVIEPRAMAGLAIVGDRYRCQGCGALSHLEVHHRELRSHSGDDAEQNLITLCTACHAMVHRGSD